MSNLDDQVLWELAVDQIDTTDAVLGGPGGPANVPHQQLANRTAYLKQQVELVTGDFAAHKVDPNPHTQYSLTSHNHDLVYALLGHDHDARYGLQINPPGFAARISSPTGSLALSPAITVPYDTVDYDPLGEYDLGAGRYRPANPGLYLVVANVSLTVNAGEPVSGVSFRVRIMKNTAQTVARVADQHDLESVTRDIAFSVVSLVPMGGNDTLRIEAASSGADAQFITPTTFAAVRVGA